MTETKRRSSRGVQEPNAAATSESAGKESQAPDYLVAVTETRGRKKGSGGILSLAQQRKVCRLIRTSEPQNLGIRARLWSRDEVRRLAIEIAHREISEESMRNYFERWGLGGIDFPRDTPADCVSALLDQIAQGESGERSAFHRDDPEIVWLHVTKVSDTEAWFSEEDTGRKLIYAVSAVTRAGLIRWWMVAGSFTATRQVAFLRRLCEDVRIRRGRNLKHRPTVCAVRTDAKTFSSRAFQVELCEAELKIVLFPTPARD